jgi:hypothetical protein
MASTFVSNSFLLALPTELRLHIYDYLLTDTNTITLTAAPLTVFGHKIRDRTRTKPIPGLPDDHCALVKYCHDPTLLSITNPPSISLDEGWPASTCDRLPFPAPLALLQTCWLIKDELADHMKRRKPREDAGGLSLHVSYPYGVVVLKEMYPYLLKQAKNVYISGYYHAPPTSQTCNAQSATTSKHNPLYPSQFLKTTERLRTRLDTSRARKPHRVNFPAHPPTTCLHAPQALAHMIRTLLPSTLTSLQVLEARIYYPGESSYSNVWGDDGSPITVLLRNTCGGEFALQIGRGRTGNAVEMMVRPEPKSRIVTTGWKILGQERGVDEVGEAEEFVVGGGVRGA